MHFIKSLKCVSLGCSIRLGRSTQGMVLLYRSLQKLNCQIIFIKRMFEGEYYEEETIVSCYLWFGLALL